MNINGINSLVLAYLGDSVYEVYVREHLIKKRIPNVNLLQKESLKYVSAKGQSIILNQLINNNILTDIELDIIKRARNTKSNTHPKNCDIITYKRATSLEALFGYLKLINCNERIEYLMNYIFNEL